MILSRGCALDSDHGTGEESSPEPRRAWYARLVIRATTIALCVVLLLPSRAAGDRWWGVDKAEHLGLSAAMAAAWYATCSLLGDDPRPVRLAISTALALTPGLLKELYDSGRPGKAFSAQDLTWDLIGAAAGSLIGIAIDWLVHRRRDPLRHGPWLWVDRGAGLVVRFH